MIAAPVLLQLGAEFSEVLLQEAATTACGMKINLGVDAIAARYFQSDPPSALAMERAIEAVEVQVMRARDLVPEGASIHWTARHAQRVMDWAQASPGAPATECDSTTVVTLDQVEMLFNRIVGRIEGRPATSDAVPTDASFVATVLIVREFLHHTLSRSLHYLKPPTASP